MIYRPLCSGSRLLAPWSGSFLRLLASIFGFCFDTVLWLPAPCSGFLIQLFISFSGSFLRLLASISGFYLGSLMWLLAPASCSLLLLRLVLRFFAPCWLLARAPDLCSLLWFLTSCSGSFLLALAPYSLLKPLTTAPCFLLWLLDPCSLLRLRPFCSGFILPAPVPSYLFRFRLFGPNPFLCSRSLLLVPFFVSVLPAPAPCSGHFAFCFEHRFLYPCSGSWLRIFALYSSSLLWHLPCCPGSCSGSLLPAPAPCSGFLLSAIAPCICTFVALNRRLYYFL